MKIIKICLTAKTIVEHDTASDNFIKEYLNTDKIEIVQLPEFVLIYPKYINSAKCFSLSYFKKQLIMGNAILIGGTINNYKDLEIDVETIKNNVYFFHDKQITINELNRLKNDKTGVLQ